MYKIVYHIWHADELRLESGSRSIYEENNPLKIIQTLESATSFGNTNLISAAVLGESGIKELHDLHKIRSFRDAMAWERIWLEAQSQVQGTIHLKEYGLRTRDGSSNLSCADFRCAQQVIRSPPHWDDVYIGCNGNHHAGDRYFPVKGIHRTWEQRRADIERKKSTLDQEINEDLFDEQFLLPQLAKELDLSRGTKAQALAKFACWKADTEHRLQYWNPF
ncbi:hypothetical protein EXS74_03710 [Candidatus Woesearchaeota archaeon]|nr:hypothetical protein [Candidatus Woesearchaeota archaeon]